MQQTVKNWLSQGVVDIFLGYKHCHGHALPHCFCMEKLEEVDELVESPARYSLEKIATHIAAQKPDLKIGLLARDCNQRALKILTIWNQLHSDHFKMLSVNCCPSGLKKHADCSYLEPGISGAYKKQVGIDNNMSLNDVQVFSDEERLSRWMYEFQKCLKCYGCRNICPVCFCEDCSLEHDDLVGTGKLPPEVPIFHLVRAVHMAGRCIDCGLCEDACPVDIPLRLLYRKVNDLFAELFDYDTGVCENPSPFNIIGTEVSLTPRPMLKPLSGTGDG